jgi:hypothetical protein
LVGDARARLFIHYHSEREPPLHPRQEIRGPRNAGVRVLGDLGASARRSRRARACGVRFGLGRADCVVAEVIAAESRGVSIGLFGSDEPREIPLR